MFIWGRELEEGKGCRWRKELPADRVFAVAKGFAAAKGVPR